MVILQEVLTSWGEHELGSVLHSTAFAAGVHLCLWEDLDILPGGPKIVVGSGVWNMVAFSEQGKVNSSVSVSLIELALLESVEILVQSSGSIIKTSCIESLGSSNAFVHSLPNVRLASLTFLDFLVCELSSKEFAVGVVLPHVEVVSSLASWHFGLTQLRGEAGFGEQVEWSANLTLGWSLWLDWDLLSVLGPSSSLPSVPHLVASVVPVDIS